MESVAALWVAAALIAAFALLSVGIVCRLMAGAAAEAGAVALMNGGDPTQAARSALAGWGRSGLVVAVRGRRVVVRFAPRALGARVGGLVAARAQYEVGDG